MPEPEGPFLAAVWSPRKMAHVGVWLRPEASIDEGSFVIVPGITTELPDHEGPVPFAEHHPGRDGTHTPVGPAELEALGLRPHVPHYGDEGAPE